MVAVETFLVTRPGTRALNLDYDVANVTNLDKLIDNQKAKIGRLRDAVKRLKFVSLDPGGAYKSITYKSFDGGLFNLHFDPFEFDIVEVTDSNGNMMLKFAAPGGDLRGTDELRRIIGDLDENPVIREFLSILGKSSLADVTEILTNRGTLMELGEFACIFNKVMSAPDDEYTIIMRDGLLRTKKIKSELIGRLKSELAAKSGHVKLVGVAKTSKVVFLLKAALACERILPVDNIGYVKIPRDIENMAYRWSGHGRLSAEAKEPLDYAFGDLYIAKLSRFKNLFVTVEIPINDDGSEMYAESDVMEILSYLAKDSMHSYPVIGYPQTIMRAHESAARLGIPSSILRDNIMNTLIENTDPIVREYVRNSKMLGDVIDKGSLGGGAW